MTESMVDLSHQRRCVVCKYEYMEQSEATQGWGATFNANGECEMCSTRQQKSLENLKQFAETQKEQRKQRREEEKAVGIPKVRKQRKDKGASRGARPKMKAYWESLSPEEKRLRMEKIWAGRRKNKLSVCLT